MIEHILVQKIGLKHSENIILTEIDLLGDGLYIIITFISIVKILFIVVVVYAKQKRIINIEAAHKDGYLLNYGLSLIKEK